MDDKTMLELEQGERTTEGVLRALSRQPRLSVWAIEKTEWLQVIMRDLKVRGLVERRDDTWPFYRYVPTWRGEEVIGKGMGVG